MADDKGLEEQPTQSENPELVQARQLLQRNFDKFLEQKGVDKTTVKQEHLYPSVKLRSGSSETGLTFPATHPIALFLRDVYQGEPVRLEAIEITEFGENSPSIFFKVTAHRPSPLEKDQQVVTLPESKRAIKEVMIDTQKGTYLFTVYDVGTAVMNAQLAAHQADVRITPQFSEKSHPFLIEVIRTVGTLLAEGRGIKKDIHLRAL